MSTELDTKHVEDFPLERGQGTFAVGIVLNFVPGAAQGSGQEHAHGVIIFGQQYLGHAESPLLGRTLSIKT